jgi:hypothetical protein
MCGKLKHTAFTGFATMFSGSLDLAYVVDTNKHNR